MFVVIVVVVGFQRYNYKHTTCIKQTTIKRTESTGFCHSYIGTAT